MAEVTPQLAKRHSSICAITGWTIVFMVLLRIALGWHLAYEGAWKLNQDDWTADSYLLASSGPLRPLFVWMVPDANGFKRLTEELILKRMDERAQTAIDHYRLDERQKKVFLNFVERKKHGIKDDNTIAALFASSAFNTQLADYREALLRGQQPNRDAIVAQIESIFDDMDKVIVSKFAEAVHAFADGLKGKDGAKADAVLKALDARLKERLPERASIVPADAPTPDDLAWLTSAYLEKKLDERYMEQIRPFYMKFKPGVEDPEVLAGFENTRIEFHQSAYGWRYRDQKKSAEARDRNNVAAIWGDADFQQQLANYKNLYDQTVAAEQQESEARGGDYNQERMLFDYGKKNSSRRELLARLETPLKDVDPTKMDTFMEQFGMNLTDEQLACGPMPREPRALISHFVNWGNMLGLTIAGICLMLGLFTRLSAFAGACLLALYYFAMPPWPGLPETPMSEGHYLIVNKNLVEMMALLMLATSRAGRWGGLDAYIGALFRSCRKGCQSPAASPAKGAAA